MSSAAIIVAAGRGTRMGPEVDKLFLPVAGQPVVAHTWRGFDRIAEIEHLVLVIRDGMQGAFEELARSLALKKPFQFAVGGRERQDSVWNGLAMLPADCVTVAIQDGARPCVDPDLVRRTLEAAAETGAAVAAQPVTDTVKESLDGQTINRHLDRNRLWAVQTPQCFRVEVIRRALATVREKGLLVTDDTAACQWIGQTVQLIHAQHPNPKVTIPADLRYIELVLDQAENLASE